MTRAIFMEKLRGEGWNGGSVGQASQCRDDNVLDATECRFPIPSDAD